LQDAQTVAAIVRIARGGWNKRVDLARQLVVRLRLRQGGQRREQRAQHNHSKAPNMFIRNSFNLFRGVQCNDFDRGQMGVNAKGPSVRQGG